MVGSKKITFYKSIEEENEATIKYRASLTPLESLHQAHRLIKSVYQDELKFSPKSNKLTFVGIK